MRRMTASSRASAIVCSVAVMACARHAPEPPIRLSPVAPQADTLTVTVHEGTQLVASLSPDGKRVAFILLGQVWLLDSAGGRAVALTNGVTDPREDWSVAWMSDSKRLAVKSYVGNGRSWLSVIDVATKAAPGSFDRQDFVDIASSPSEDAITGVQISGDSSILWKVPLGGAGAPVPGRVVRRPIGEPAFSSDGRSLAYVGPISAFLKFPTDSSDLWEMDVATGVERRLFTDSTLDGYPAYSPDGRWLAFLSERSGTRQLWLLPRAGGPPQALTTDAEDVYLGPLSWLPDSRGVLYTGAGKIRVAPLSGGVARTIEFDVDLTVARWRGLRRPVLPEPGERRRVRGIFNPELSPDGRRIVFAALGDLWVVDATGGVPRRLTRTPIDEARPRWSPDGTRLAYVTFAENAERELRMLEVAHPARVRTIGVPPSPYYQPEFAWSPDGKRIAVIDGTRIGWIGVATGRMRIVHRLPHGVQRSSILGWTRGGDSIAFRGARADGFSEALAGGFSAARLQWTMWKVSADSGAAVLWELPGAYASHGVWSADLSRAAYADLGKGGHVTATNSEQAVPIADPSPRFFSWSAGGRRLLYLFGDRLRLLEVASGETRSVALEMHFRVPLAPSLLIRNVRIIDGTGSPATSPSDVLIEGGRIARISAVGTGRQPRAARVIDAGGRTLTPGLFNLHAHQDPAKLFHASNLYHGVTSIRDVGSTAEWMQSQRERVDGGVILGPRVFATGGFVGSYAGGSLVNVRYVDPADSASMASVIAALAAVGTDIIKTNQPRSPQFAASVSRAVHAAGLPMTSHHIFPATLASGIEGKEHTHLYYRHWATPPYRDDVAQAMRAGNMCVTATLLSGPGSWAAGRSRRLPLDSTFFRDSVYTKLYPPSVLQAARARLREPPMSARDMATYHQVEGSAFASMLRLHQAGVRVVTGTDVSGPLDEIGVLLETQLLVLAGFTPLAAIRAATLDAASCLGVENDLGSVEVGKLADFIIVDGDPATDIRDLRRIKWVVRGGVAYTRQDILKSVEGAGIR